MSNSLTRHNRKAVCVVTAAIVLLALAIAQYTFAASGKKRLAIVEVAGIKPYEALCKTICRQLGDNFEIKTFELGSDNQKTVHNIKNFAPDFIISIGNKASEICSAFNIAPVIAAYDTKLLPRQNPLSLISYLKADAKKVTAIAEDANDFQRNSLAAAAVGYGLELTIKDAKPVTWDDLLSVNSTVFLNEGLLLIRNDSKTTPSSKQFIVGVVDRTVYGQLEQLCNSLLPKIDEFIDIRNLSSQDFAKKLAELNPTAVIAIGCNSYSKCKFMENVCPVLAVLKTRPSGSNALQWTSPSGVNMFIDPNEQIQVLRSIVKKPLTLAIPYSCENTEELVLKILLQPSDDIEFVAIPISDSSHAPETIRKAFAAYDGIWVIPDSILAVAPIQKLLLEQSLLKKKLLLTMMHPYTKAGAAMAVSSVEDNENQICDKIVELIFERLSKPTQCVGRIVSPPVSVSLNLLTLKKLNYQVPDAVLNQAKLYSGDNKQ